MDFFILGNPRSGTSLLRVLLNNHAQIGVPPECGLIQWWYSKYQNWSNSDSNSFQRSRELIQDILSSKKIEEWGITSEDIESVLAMGPNSYQELMDQLYRKYTGKPIIGDKNNYYIHHLEELATIYPDSKYIHLIRDGRDVACSYLAINELPDNLKYKPKVPNEIKEIATEWVQNVNRIENFLANRPHVTIRYRDLVTQPIGTLDKIGKLLNVTFDKSILDYRNSLNEPESTMQWKKKLLSGIDAQNTGKYKKELNQEQCEAFYQIAGPTLQKFNYES